MIKTNFLRLIIKKKLILLLKIKFKMLIINYSLINN